MNSRSKIVVHPIIFGVYPVLFAYAHNIDFAPPPSETLMLVGLFAAGAALLWAVAARVISDVHKAALATSLSIAVFFSYGHLARLVGVPLSHFHILSISFGENRAPALIWLVAVLMLACWLRRTSRETARLATVVLNRVGVVLIALIAIDLATSVYASSHATAAASAPRRAAAMSAARPRPSGPTGDLPDIYYIILDEYARADILKDLYGFDNSPFLDFLRNKGFYVADQSQSNYSQTMLSLASSLNSEYLDAERLQAASFSADPSWHVTLNVAAARYFEKGRAFGIDGTGLTTSRLPLAHMIQYSSAVQTLKSHGYRFAAFTSGYGGVQLPHADIVMRAHVVDDFEEVLIDATPIPRTLERLSDGIELHRERVQYVFDHLSDRLGDGSPLFVFAHIMCPHTPFVFEPDGSRMPRSEVVLDDRLSNTSAQPRGAVVSGYRKQIQFVNRRIETVINAILARSSKPPIIILQGDHGSELTLDQINPSRSGIRERMSILNAYYVPAAIRAKLYPQITPVNSFRLVFGEYFAGDRAPLPDESYFSTWTSPYEFTAVDRSFLPR